MTIFGQPGADQAYGVINGESWSDGRERLPLTVTQLYFLSIGGHVVGRSYVDI